MQATQFAAYGNLYQSISAQAQAIHQTFVNALGTSAGSYAATEAANSAAAGSSGSGLSGILGLGGSASSGSVVPFQAGPLSALANAYNAVGGNFGSAASDMVELSGGSGFLNSEIMLPAARGAGHANSRFGWRYGRSP